MWNICDNVGWILEYFSNNTSISLFEVVGYLSWVNMLHHTSLSYQLLLSMLQYLPVYVTVSGVVVITPFTISPNWVLRQILSLNLTLAVYHWDILYDWTTQLGTKLAVNSSLIPMMHCLKWNKSQETLTDKYKVLFLLVSMSYQAILDRCTERQVLFAMREDSIVSWSVVKQNCLQS